MRHKKSRITYANVTSTLALALVAGGGTAYAAGLVGTDDLKKGAVTRPKLAKNAVTGSKVKSGSLRLSDLAVSPFTDTVARSTSATFDGDEAGSLEELTVSCAAGESLVSGGHDVSALSVDVLASRPATEDGGTLTQGQRPEAWRVLARQGEGGAFVTVTVWAVCTS